MTIEFYYHEKAMSNAVTERQVRACSHDRRIPTVIHVQIDTWDRTAYFVPGDVDKYYLFIYSFGTIQH